MIETIVFVVAVTVILGCLLGELSLRLDERIYGTRHPTEADIQKKRHSQ